MATAVTAQIKVDIAVSETNTGAGINSASAALLHKVLYDSGLQASGTASSTQDRVWSDAQTVANGAPDTWDLAGTLTSELSGATITFAEVTLLWIRNRSTTTGENLEIGAGSNPWITWLKASGDAIIVPPGGVFLLTSPIDGFASTAGTGDILTITSASGTITYDILIAGRSA